MDPYLFAVRTMPPLEEMMAEAYQVFRAYWPSIRPQLCSYMEQGQRLETLIILCDQKNGCGTVVPRERVIQVLKKGDDLSSRRHLRFATAPVPKGFLRCSFWLESTPEIQYWFSFKVVSEPLPPEKDPKKLRLVVW